MPNSFAKVGNYDFNSIPFNRIFTTGNEIDYILEACQNGQLAGDGDFTKRCQFLISKLIGVGNSLICNSCTAALEMCAILLGIEQGDEIILPSYTFVSTANAFVLRGAIPVFVDISLDTLCIDIGKIEQAITSKTKAIVPVHYAGISCDMDYLSKLAQEYKLPIIEDAAQGFLAKYKDSYLDSLGDLSAFSFHETKNIISGEGGALVLNNSIFLERAEIVREKGTNRTKFFRGEIDKYTWVDIGSSFLPGELVCAFLFAQLQASELITAKRLSVWNPLCQESCHPC